MATTKQRAAAKRNVKKAQAAAQDKQTLKNLPKRTRTALGKEAAAVRRGDAPRRRELYDEARRLGIDGRAKMRKAEPKRAGAAPDACPARGASGPAGTVRWACRSTAWPARRWGTTCRRRPRWARR